MNYEKQTWERGETISADKLNHIEEGIANSGRTSLIVNATSSMLVPDMSPLLPDGTEAHKIAVDDAVTIDVLFDDIKQALDSGNEVVIHLTFSNVVGDGYEVLYLSTYAGPVEPFFPGLFEFSRQCVNMGENNFAGISAYTLRITPIKNTLLAIIDGHTMSDNVKGEDTAA